jgi:hypothetical protein
MSTKEELKSAIEQEGLNFINESWNIDDALGDIYMSGALSKSSRNFWQDGMYSEEEVRKLILEFWFFWYNQNKGTNTYEAFEKWFEKHKKK